MRNPNTQCSICTKPIYRRPSTTKQFPMSLCWDCRVERARIGAKAQRESQYNKFINLWRDGKVSGRMGKSRVSAHIRRYLYQSRGEQCERCKWKEMNAFTNKIPLQLHHKDGNWKNNSEENLELLCPNCHSLTEFYGSRNKGRGRPRE